MGGQTLGYTLMEVMITVAIIAILASVALPNYNKSIRLSRWQTARDTLMNIYNGEQLYFSLNNSYDTGWSNIYIEDPNRTTTESGIGYAVVSAGATTFCATATTGTLIMAIDQTRTLYTTAAPSAPCNNLSPDPNWTKPS